MSQVPNGTTGEQPANAPRGNRAERGSRARSLDAIFDLLASRRRRHALYALYRREAPTAVTDLADEVAARDETAPERVALSLHHVHLPKLAAAGVVDYDAEDGTVRFGDCTERFHRYLRSAAADDGRDLEPTTDGEAFGERDASGSDP